MVEAARVAEWDDDLVAAAHRGPRRARRRRSTSRCPSSLSATSLARLRDDPEAFARELARPMPRPPAPAARFGTAFHAWVEDRFGQQALIEPDELPGRADAGIDDEADLGEVVKRFEDGPFGDRAPHAVEAPFALVLAGQVVRGRIDAVYAEPPTGRRLPRRRLEDQPPRDRRPAPARPLPPRLVRAHRHARSSGCARRSTTSAPAAPSSSTTCPTGAISRSCSLTSEPPER